MSGDPFKARGRVGRISHKGRGYSGKVIPLEGEGKEWSHPRRRYEAEGPKEGL